MLPGLESFGLFSLEFWFPLWRLFSEPVQPCKVRTTGHLGDSVVPGHSVVLSYPNMEVF